MKLSIISEDAGTKIECGRGTGNNFIISDGLIANYINVIDVIVVKTNSDQDIIDVTSKIKHLEKQFKHLHRSIRTELKSKENITIEEFLYALTLADGSN